MSHKLTMGELEDEPIYVEPDEVAIAQYAHRCGARPNHRLSCP